MNHLIILICVFLLTGCGITPRIPLGTHENVTMTQDSIKVPRTKLPRCAKKLSDGSCDQSLFVGVAISGGGSRAANFGLGALWQLKQLQMYDDITAISSVSGGSLASTYTALFGLKNRQDFDKAAAKLRQDFLNRWILKSINPVNLAEISLTDRDSTNTLADTFDDLLFDGKTFDALNDPELGQTLLFINATLANRISSRSNLSTRGENSPSMDLQGFTFTSDAFNELYSDLDKLRLATAVAASGAYPGVFEAVTLRNFNPFLENPGDPKMDYLHLIDGGAADNLGVDALVRAFQNMSSMHINARGDKTEEACLLILIDAHVTDSGSQEGNLRDLRTGLSDNFISSSLSRAFDSLLSRRREDQLKQLDIELSSDAPQRFVPDVSIPLGNYSYYDGGYYKSRLRPKTYKDSTEKSNVHCGVWHIALDRLLELTSSREAGGGRFHRENFGPWAEHDPDYGKSKDDISIERLDTFVNSVDTNYRLELAGPGHCDPEVIQQALFDASNIMVLRDRDTLTELAKWLRNNHGNNLADNIAQHLSQTESFNMPNPPEFTSNPPTFFYRTGNWLNCTTQSQ